MTKKQDLEISNKIIEDYAGEVFPTDFAKLYAHHSRLQAKKDGLKSWNDKMFESQLNRTLLLIEYADVQRNVDNNKFKNALKRAGELLEWLAHPEINKNYLPLYSLSAACYQLAEYPARGLGVLNKYDIDNNQSKILQSLLKADFTNIITLLSDYYTNNLNIAITNADNNKSRNLSLQQFIVNETIRIIGIVYSYFRWGDEDRLDIAIKKFDAIENFMLHGKDSFSWILCKLCNQIIKIYIETSLRKWIRVLKDTVNEDGKKALDLYVKLNFLENKTLAWTSQIKGIKELIKNESFLLCTPTGSGKTTIAELAIIQSLLSEDITDEINDNIALYIVPKRALAAEVEFKLSKILTKNLNTNIQITSLYGGNDYGPDEISIKDALYPSVLICTQEKTDALIRLLGNDFLKKIRLVIIDEAHNINLEDARALCLETLIVRLKMTLQQNTRFIGLSAIANGIEKSLSAFISGNDIPVESDYRSTRQTIGRLYYSPAGSYEQYADIMDGKIVTLENEETQSPYILNPIENCPFPEKYNNLESSFQKMKPRLFWAALNYAAQKNKNKNKTVLISILSIENIISKYANSLLKYLEEDLSTIKNIPQYFTVPTSDKLILYNKALTICQDYFGKNSVEYKLLKKGVVLHHGKMPGRLGRILVQLVEQNIINVVLANSTLIEGINLPFEIILLPYASLKRNPNDRNDDSLIDIKSFKNLIGRAGRPCLTTEGQTYILLPQGEKQLRYLHQNYKDILNEFINSSQDSETSALFKLLEMIYNKWQKITHETGSQKFIEWIENARPIDDNNEATDALDHLDEFLLSAIEEIDSSANINDLEDKISKIWGNTYANYINNIDYLFYKNVINLRSKALLKTIYPNKKYRNYFYKVSLSPKITMELIAKYSEIHKILKEGESYFSLGNNCRINYIMKIVQIFNEIEKIKIDKKFETIKKHIEWWFSTDKTLFTGTASNHYDFISKEFLYKFTRNISAFVSLCLLDKVDLKRNQKEKTGLPWIIFWLKDIITWGTLDPVTAYVMANNTSIITRKDAQNIAQDYYNAYIHINDDEIFNPETIKKWYQEYRLQYNETFEKKYVHNINKIEVELYRDPMLYTQPKYKVIPIIKNDKIYWIDVAGYIMAVSDINDVNIHKNDYILYSKKKCIISNKYI